MNTAAGYEYDEDRIVVVCCPVCKRRHVFARYIKIYICGNKQVEVVQEADEGAEALE